MPIFRIFHNVNSRYTYIVIIFKFHVRIGDRVFEPNRRLKRLLMVSGPMSGISGDLS